jgi:phage major head subunit gpT-like protein
MAITNISVFENASTTYKTLADEIFGQKPPGVFSAYTSVMPTDGKIVEHDVIEAFPVVREWSGAKQFPDAQAASTTLTIKTYEASFRIKRLDLATDRTGSIGRRLQMFLQEQAYIYDKLAHEALVANATGYDGVSLIHASHPRGPAGATQSNTTTSALSFSTFETAMVAGASLRDANSEPLAINYNLLRVGPKLASVAREITGSAERVVGIDAAGVNDSGTRIAAATIPNVRGVQVFSGGSVSVVVDPRLVGTYDDYWYLVDTSRGAMPLVGYEFRSPEAISLDAMDGEARFETDYFKYSVECDVVFGPGAWQTIYGGIVS